VRFAFLYTLRERDEPAYAALSAQEAWLKRIFKVWCRDKARHSEFVCSAPNLAQP